MDNGIRFSPLRVPRRHGPPTGASRSPWPVSPLLAAACLFLLLPWVPSPWVSANQGAFAPGSAPKTRPAGDTGAAWRVRDEERMRWEGIVRQTTSRSCGPAALATLLTYYLGIPVSEREAARRALGLEDGTGDDAALHVPATMRGL